MVRIVILDVLTTILLLGGALLVLLWKKDLKKKSHKLVNRIALGMGIMGFREIINLLYQIILVTEEFFLYSLLCEIIGVLIMVFALFNYLEAESK